MQSALHTSTRRRTLTALAGTASAVATGGCLNHLQSVANRDSGDHISVEIKAPPADANPLAISIARTLAKRLDAVGVGASVTPVATEELYRQVLINNEFDLYVGRYPTTDIIEPDDLYPLLHSRFISEPGWQNPFGCADLRVDTLLERQRRLTGTPHHDAVMELQRVYADLLPFTVLTFPVELSAVRTGQYDGWNDTTGGFDTPIGLLELDRTTESMTEPAPDEHAQLRLATTDGRIIENRNPLAAEFRNAGVFTGLLYDPLARRYEGEFIPWLATDVTWDQQTGDDVTETDTETGTPENGEASTADVDGLTATVTLREGLRWHDGESITASDVAFTYAFLDDTSMGNLDSPVPAPRFRGRSSLVSSVRATGKRTLEFSFDTKNQSVAVNAFSIPILPEHIWIHKTDEVNIPGLETVGVTEALVWMNPKPVGSGPITFDHATTGESILFSRFRDHFLTAKTPPADVPVGLQGKPAFDGLFVKLAPSDSTAVKLAAAGDVDATVSPLGQKMVPQIARSNEIRLVAADSWSFYHLGFNMRHAPLSNPHFRQAVSGLLDAGRIAAQLFGGYAHPAATPLAGTEWELPELRWDAETRAAGFYGENGELNVERARDAFRNAGYRYDEEGRLRQ